MLISSVLEVICLREGKINCNTGMHLQELFYSLLNNWNSDMFNKIHTSTTLKPFTVSPLQGLFVSKHGKLKLTQGGQYWFRFTSLSDELSELLRKSLRTLKGSTIDIGGVSFYVERVYHSEKEHFWARSSSYDRLFSYWHSQEANLNDTVRVRFFSPTYFRDGKLSVPLPIPELCVKSILSKWNTFSPEKIDTSEIDSLMKEVTISYHKIESKILDFKGFRRIGFVGECEFKVNHEQNDQLLRIFNLLWEYAFFSGVGASTTYGMGQVRTL